MAEADEVGLTLEQAGGILRQPVAWVEDCVKIGKIAVSVLLFGQRAKSSLPEAYGGPPNTPLHGYYRLTPFTVRKVFETRAPLVPWVPEIVVKEPTCTGSVEDLEIGRADLRILSGELERFRRDNEPLPASGEAEPKDRGHAAGLERVTMGDIAKHFGVSQSTARRWKKKGLPLRRSPTGRKLAYMGNWDEIERWVEAAGGKIERI